MFRNMRHYLILLNAFLKNRKCSQCSHKFGVLHCYEEFWICETCAQINSEQGFELELD